MRFGCCLLGWLWMKEQSLGCRLERAMVDDDESFAWVWLATLWAW